MDETNNVFDITDYGGYFNVSVDNNPGPDEPVQDIQNPEDATSDSEQPDNPVTPANEEPLTQETQAFPLAETTEPPVQYTEVLQDINAHVTNIETLSIGILLALGLILGLIISRIFLDKLWR